MATTLKEQIEELTKARHKLAVWESLAAYLDENFLSKDGRPSQKGLKASDCLVELVPEEVIEEIMQSIGTGPIAELRNKVEQIEGQEIVIPKGQTDEPSKQQEA